MRIKFSELYDADLIVGTVYEGGSKGNISDDVISKLMKCENSGGFRKVGKTNPIDLKYVILFSTLQEEHWMDIIDEHKRILIYHGDNRIPDKNIMDTPKKGNLILKHSFDALKRGERKKIPPFFIFTKEVGRNVVFRGLAVPKKGSEESLHIVQEIVEGKKIENYKAWFDILNINTIDRNWIDDLKLGNGYYSSYAPQEWKDWVDTGKIVQNINYLESNEADNGCVNEVTITQYEDLNSLMRELEEQVRRAQVDTREDRQNRIKRAKKFPKQVKITTTTYQRNADVIAEVLGRANGICEKCGATAPFIRVSDGTPYLEVHHKIRLADGGEDTVENAIAVCPNCHRELHFGI